MSVYTVCNSICIFRCITSMKMFSNFFNPDSKNFMERVFVNHHALCHDMLGKYFYDGFITVSIASFFFYAPKGTSGGILKSNRPSVCPSVRPSVRLLQIVSQRYLKNY